MRKTFFPPVSFRVWTAVLYDWIQAKKMKIASTEINERKIWKYHLDNDRKVIFVVLQWKLKHENYTQNKKKTLHKKKSSENILLRWKSFVCVCDSAKSRKMKIWKFYSFWDVSFWSHSVAVNCYYMKLCKQLV